MVLTPFVIVETVVVPVKIKAVSVLVCRTVSNDALDRRSIAYDRSCLAHIDRG